MTHRIDFHPAAREDLFDLYRYVEERSGPERAGGYIDRIRRLCEGLAEFPERAWPRDDLVPGLRVLTMDRRVLVALRVESRVVTILRVIYAGRDFRGEDVPH